MSILYHHFPIFSPFLHIKIAILRLFPHSWHAPMAGQRPPIGGGQVGQGAGAVSQDPHGDAFGQRAAHALQVLEKHREIHCQKINFHHQKKTCSVPKLETLTIKNRCCHETFGIYHGKLIFYHTQFGFSWHPTCNSRWLRTQKWGML